LCATAAAVALVVPTRTTLAQAQPAATTGTTGLEEIVVTSRRREERVQTVPLAVTAFSQASLEKAQIKEVHDLAQHVPSLAVSLSQSDSNALYSGQVRLRGLPGTEIYLADVPIGNADYQGGTGLQHGLSEGNLYDLEDIEIVKGPQGTLFGKNSVGGLISIQPHRPTFDYEGYVRVGFGNYNNKEYEASVNIPIIQDKLAIRIASQGQFRDGYTEELTQHKDLDNKDYWAFRVGVLARPTDDITNFFMYDSYYQHTNGSGDIVSFINPNFTASRLGSNFAPLPPNLTAKQVAAQCFAVVTLQGPGFAPINGFPAGGCPNAKFQIGIYPDVTTAFNQQQALGPRAVVGDDFQKIGKDYFYGLTDVLTWDITDNLTLKNIAAARVFKQLATDDYTPIGIPILNIGIPGNNQQWNNNEVQYTEEIQLQGKALNDKLTYVVGGFLEYDHPLGDTQLGSAALGNSVAGAVSYFHFNIQTRSRAAFVHGDYDLGDYVEGLKITGGYRYTWDEVSTGARGLSNADTKGAPCTGVFLTDSNCYQSAPFAHFSSYGWNTSLEWQADTNTLLYVRAGNAYRPGGSNLNVTPDFANFKPEHITDVEIGVKSDWDLWGVHGRTNADIYHSTYKDIQVQKLVTLTDAAGKLHTNTINLNAASATLEGGEVEATILPFGKALEISPHASYIFPKYDQYPIAFSPLGAETPFLYVPKWQYAITGTYHLPIDESWGDIALSATYSWYGHQYDSVSPGEIYLIEPSYDNLDLRVDWTDVLSYPVDLSFYMRNATDNLYVQGAVPIYTQLGFTSLSYNPPRMFGFNVKYRFSEAGSEAAAASTYTPPPAQPVAPAAPHSYLVFFDFNKSDLTMQAKGIVDQAAANAGPAHVTRLTVTGHTDTVGSDAYNMRLSRRRAESVAAQLEKDGIPSGEIEIVAKGKRDLLVPTADGVREPQNRRVQIVYDGGPTS